MSWLPPPRRFQRSFYNYGSDDLRSIIDFVNGDTLELPTDSAIMNEYHRYMEQAEERWHQLTVDQVSRIRYLNVRYQRLRMLRRRLDVGSHRYRGELSPRHYGAMHRSKSKSPQYYGAVTRFGHRY